MERAVKSVTSNNQSKTGVKNCDKVARSYGKVGIYFENNGHGTVLKNNHHYSSKIRLIGRIMSE